MRLPIQILGPFAVRNVWMALGLFGTSFVGSSPVRAFTASAVVGQSATLTVTVDGTPPFSYLWAKDGAAIAGANSATYTLSAIALADAGKYSVAVSNSAGATTSDEAILTVNSPTAAPTISTQPAAQTVTEGQPVSFSIVAAGSGSLTYQWKKNGANIPGATSATFTISAASSTDAALYSVVVSNSVGSLASVSVNLTVNPALSSVVTSTVGTSSVVTAITVQQLLPTVGQTVTNWKEFKPQKITIAPYPGVAIDFDLSSLRDQNGRTVWTGRNTVQGAFLVAAATESDWQATLVIPPTGAFEIHVAGQTVTVLEKNHEVETCGTRAGLEKNDSSIKSQGTGAAAANTVDVLFFYDADTLTQFQNTPANFETRMMANIAACNMALQNSGVTNFQWRYLASYQVPAYTPTNDLTNDLYLITGVSANSVSAPNAVSNFVSEKAVLHGADQVVLSVGGARNYAGLAWISSGPTPTSLPLAYHSSVVAWNASYMSLAHQLSHNFGCYHDRQAEGAADGDGLYHYGYRFLDSANRDTGTIMTSALYRLPYYSNPKITLNGSALGVPENQPKAANDSRVLTENAQAMSDSRAAVDPPAITSQPQSVTIAQGQPFSLSVTATGSGLTYQWSQAGASLAGATLASYSKTAAGATDAGSYTVTVSNVAGQVTSTAATVTLTGATSSNAPAAATPAASGGGGGGGGGAIDETFAGLCGLLVLLRWVLRKSEN